MGIILRELRGFQFECPPASPTLPTLLVDDREPSSVQVNCQNRFAGVFDVRIERLEAADFVLDLGHTKVGVERKTPSDLKSSFLDNRLLGRQAPKMLELYSTGALLVDTQGEHTDYHHNGMLLAWANFTRWPFIETANIYSWIKTLATYHSKPVHQSEHTIRSPARSASTPLEEYYMALPGIGAKSALKLAKAYPKPGVFERDLHSGALMLNDILSASQVKKLYAFFYGEDHTDVER